jgi:hypothetical protein
VKRLGGYFYGVLLAALVTGCSSIHFTQDPKSMLVRTGSIDVELDAAPYADVFLTYALLSDQAYKDGVYETRSFALEDKAYCHPAGDASCVDLTPLARSILSQWRLIYASMDPKHFPCKPERSGCTEPLQGLGVQIWVRQGSECRETVVAFRGTDRRSSEDWISNLRWLLRLLPFYDQYQQVQDYTPEFIKAIEKEPCFVEGRTQIVAVGHSLGGGLAQQAAYMDRKIRQVYAFDPSIVTGSSDSPVKKVWDQTVPGLKIERIYEHGEFLAYLRFLQRHLLPPPACNPQVRSIRLGALHGSITSQHSLSGLITILLHWSSITPAADKRLELPQPGPADCPQRQL